MNKKAQEGPGILVTLIIAIAVLAVGFGIYSVYSEYVSSRSNIDARRTWVDLRAASQGADIVTSEKSPVINLDKPLEIKSEENLRWHGNEPPKAFKDIANSMVDCWSANSLGEKDYLNSIDKEVDCFPCRAITFSDEIKRNNVKMIGFERYLNEQHVRGKDSPTYLQFLANDPAYTLDEEGLRGDEIVIDDDLYIFFFAASGRGWTNIFTNVLGEGDIEEETVVDTKGVVKTSSGDIESLALTAVPIATQTGRYALPTLTRKFSEAAAKEGVETIVPKVIDGELIFDIAEKSTPTAKKTTAKILSRVLSTKGVKFIAAKAAGWPLTVAFGAAGTLGLIFGDKPFSAKVMVVDPGQVHEICNA